MDLNTLVSLGRPVIIKGRPVIIKGSEEEKGGTGRTFTTARIQLSKHQVQGLHGSLASIQGLGRKGLQSINDKVDGGRFNKVGGNTSSPEVGNTEREREECKFTVFSP